MKMLLFVVLAGATAAAQGTRYTYTPIPTDWTACKQQMAMLQPAVDAFNASQPTGSPRLTLNCSQSVNNTALPKQFVPLTRYEARRLAQLRHEATAILDSESIYEEAVIAAHHIYRPPFGPCAWWVFIGPDDDFITVDPNPLLENCRATANE